MVIIFWGFRNDVWSPELHATHACVELTRRICPFCPLRHMQMPYYSDINIRWQALRRIWTLYNPAVVQSCSRVRQVSTQDKIVAGLEQGDCLLLTSRRGVHARPETEFAPCHQLWQWVAQLWRFRTAVLRSSVAATRWSGCCTLQRWSAEL